MIAVFVMPSAYIAIIALAAIRGYDLCKKRYHCCR